MGDVMQGCLPSGGYPARESGLGEGNVVASLFDLKSRVWFRADVYCRVLCHQMSRADHVKNVALAKERDPRDWYQVIVDLQNEMFRRLDSLEALGAKVDRLEGIVCRMVKDAA